MNLTRREFVKESMATLGFVALPGGLFAPLLGHPLRGQPSAGGYAPLDWKPKRKPDLVFGVLADTHLMTDWDGKSVYRTMTLDYIKSAFAYFKEMNVDAVILLGDAAHRGKNVEIQYHRDIFEKFFPHGKAKDGHKVEKLLVVGNHELYGNVAAGAGAWAPHIWKDPVERAKHVLCADLPKGAKLVVEKGRDGVPPPSAVAGGTATLPGIRIKIPMADGNPKSRVYAYDVVVMADDDSKNRYFKSVFFAGVGFGEGHEDNDGITLVDVPVQDLPKGEKLTVAVRPVSSLGTKGKAIATKWRV